MPPRYRTVLFAGFGGSLYGSAREASGRIGLFTGMAALPIANWIDPATDIPVAGIPVAARVTALACGFAIDLVAGRRLPAGILVAEAILVGSAFAYS